MSDLPPDPEQAPPPDPDAEEPGPVEPAVPVLDEPGED